MSFIPLEIKDNLTRVSAKVMDAVNRTWNSINDFARSHQPDYQPNMSSEELDSSQDSNEVLHTTTAEGL